MADEVHHDPFQFRSWHLAVGRADAVASGDHSPWDLLRATPGQINLRNPGFIGNRKKEPLGLSPLGAQGFRRVGNWGLPTGDSNPKEGGIPPGGAPVWRKKGVPSGNPGGVRPAPGPGRAGFGKEFPTRNPRGPGRKIKPPKGKGDPFLGPRGGGGKWGGWPWGENPGWERLTGFHNGPVGGRQVLGEFPFFPPFWVGRLEPGPKKKPGWVVPSPGFHQTPHWEGQGAPPKEPGLGKRVPNRVSPCWGRRGKGPGGVCPHILTPIWFPPTLGKTPGFKAQRAPRGELGFPSPGVGFPLWGGGKAGEKNRFPRNQNRLPWVGTGGEIIPRGGKKRGPFWKGVWGTPFVLVSRGAKAPWLGWGGAPTQGGFGLGEPPGPPIMGALL